MRAEDYLKYAAAIVRQRIEWTTDEVGGSMCDQDHDIPLNALSDLRGEIEVLAARFGDINTYSDGRKVYMPARIDDGLTTGHVWHPDLTQEASRSWRGNLLHDPGTPCPGVYEVTTHPETQDIHVRVVRTA